MIPDEVAASRFELIAPLIADGLDKGHRHDLMLEIAQRSGVSERTLRRYVSAWKEGGFEKLKPKSGWERPDSRLPDGFGGVVEAAIQLRRESPSRSVSDIIKILELEGAVTEGSVARSTLQRHLAARGYAAGRMRMYVNKGAAARRFRKSHRNMLWQSDIKYGPHVRGKDGKNHQIYLVCWIDDATRFIVCAKFYPDQKVGAIEDSLRLAVQKHGSPDAVFVDNGKQYRSKWLSEACARMGIRLLTARPYHPESKGCIERFNRTVSKFISEAVIKKLGSIDEYNKLLRIWLDEYYHVRPHSTLGGVSPKAAFGSDSRPLRFLPAEVLREAFLHTETRKVDKTGCVSFGGTMYEVGVAYVGMKIKIGFDPSWEDEVEVYPEGAPSFVAKKLIIGENCGTRQKIPEDMKMTKPETSRMLDALEARARGKGTHAGVATTFSGFFYKDDGKEGDGNV
jgi:transposase InsO family protein